MAISGIEELCAGLCELTGPTPPALAPDAQGTRCATVRVKGAYVQVRQFRDMHPDRVFLRTDLGEMPGTRGQGGWQALMDANLRLIGESAPVFGRHPASGHAVLQWNCALMETHVPDFHHRVMLMAYTARRWREGTLLEDRDADWSELTRAFGPQPVAESRRDASAARFVEFRDGLARCLGEPNPPPLATTPVRGFDLCVKGVQIALLHSALEDESGATALIRLGHGSVESFMELNFHLATENPAARICRDGSGCGLLLYAVPIARITPRQFLELASRLADLTLQWQSESSTQALLPSQLQTGAI